MTFEPRLQLSPPPPSTALVECSLSPHALSATTNHEDLVGRAFCRSCQGEGALPLEDCLPEEALEALPAARDPSALYLAGLFVICRPVLFVSHQG